MPNVLLRFENENVQPAKNTNAAKLAQSRAFVNPLFIS